MKPVLIDVDTLRQPTKAPFLPYISRDRLERAMRKLPKGKLQPTKPFLDFWPAPWDPDKLLIIPGPFPDPRRRGCRWVIRRVRSASGTHMQIRYECSDQSSNSGTCTAPAITVGGTPVIECLLVQATCRGICQVNVVQGLAGSGAQCQCRDI